MNNFYLVMVNNDVAFRIGNVNTRNWLNVVNLN